MPPQIPERSLTRKIGAHYLAYEHHLAAIFFIAGFTFDVFLFQAIDYVWKHALIGTYLGIAAGSILWYQHHTRTDTTPDSLVSTGLPFVIQFAFGGMMSTLFIYFFQSAALIQSWFFLGGLFLFLIGNEFNRGKYRQLEFQVSILFLCLFAFAIVFMPSFFGTVGAKVFLVSTAVSLALAAIFLLLLSFVNGAVVRKTISHISVAMLSIALSVNMLYFTHLIPPIPLILVDAGVFHYMERVENGDYVGLAEGGGGRNIRSLFTKTVHVEDGGSLSFFSSVFAPTALSAPLAHEWQEKGETGWVTRMHIDFQVSGGRKEGYRAYSEKAVTPGVWRVRVRTKEGDVLGTYTFIVVTGTPEALQEVRR